MRVIRGQISRPVFGYSGGRLPNVVASLLLAVTGGMLTVAGSLVTLHFQARNSREIRREQYLREDTYRLFEKRVDAYSTLYLRLGATRRALYLLAKSGPSEGGEDEARAMRSDYWAAYTKVRLFGSRKAFQIANDLLIFIDQSIDGAEFDQTRYSHLLRCFTDTVRKELLADNNLEIKRDSSPLK